MPPRPGALSPGLYELLLTERVRALLESVAGKTSARLGKSEAARVVSRHIADFLARALDTVPDDERPDAQVRIANRLIDELGAALGKFVAADDRILPEVLHAITSEGRTPERPELPLAESGLYVNARRERRIGLALQKELASADRVDLICAFLFWDGYRELRPSIHQHLEGRRGFRILTTTYRGVTQAKVIEDLLTHGAEVRISYRNDATRLHAKAWLFHRNSGFSTAYIGSSNLSRSALVSGLEWNVRLSEIENRGVLDEFRGAFDAYWNDSEFEPYNPERFAQEVRAQRPDRTISAIFDLRPRPFQQEMLDRIQAERDLHDRHHNLVVAATGTGKTVIAALDYRRLCEQTKRRPTLLFVAHRREILSQSMDTYRHALSDPSFGERFVDGQHPSNWSHVFASVQSLAQENVDDWPQDRFDVVIVDEFHHASAENETYSRLLRRLRPRELLGLTATPERPDGAPILDWFDGRIASELRLWDAIDRGLLVPFQYFAIHDLTSIENVRFLPGDRLDPRELGVLYTGDQRRAHLAVEAVRQHVEDPSIMRALVFCASVDHARYMADSFTKAGLSAACVTGATPRAERDKALAGLRNGTVRCICAVDVFNEGVDIPDLDTVLFLRPTESAIVFQQQLGRGLRRAPGKRCLTVLDFVGKADHRFRYDVRYRVLLGDHVGRTSIRRQLEEGFPFLPSGCAITFDRISRETVLDNLSHGIGANRRSLIRELRGMGPVDLRTFLRESQLQLDDVYRNGRTFSELKRAAGHPCPPPGPREDELGRGLGRILHADDRLRISAWRDLAARDTFSPPTSVQQERLTLMLSTVLLGRTANLATLADLWRHPAIRLELSEILEQLDAGLDHSVLPFRLNELVPLSIHARFRLAEIMAAFGDWRDGQLYLPREGEHLDESTRCNLLFVTLQKDEEDYSPTTMYRDYAMGPRRFHWQSQSGTRPTDRKGIRHIEHTAKGITPLLFVRESKQDDRNESMPYLFLGPAHIVGWSGERPMNIEWELEQHIPASILRMASVVG